VKEVFVIIKLIKVETFYFEFLALLYFTDVTEVFLNQIHDFLDIHGLLSLLLQVQAGLEDEFKFIFGNFIQGRLISDYLKYGREVMLQIIDNEDIEKVEEAC